MHRALFLLPLLAGLATAAEDGNVVKPASVEAKKQADTQLFVTTIPKGAKVVIDGEEVGDSPQLFVVPEGARTMVVEVELSGFGKGRRQVEIRGGKITRVTFELRGDATAVSTAEGSRGAKAAPAPIQDPREVALTYARALAEADEAALRPLWKLDEPLDREVAVLIVDGIRWARKEIGGPPRIELAHGARIREDAYMACYYVQPIPPFGDKPGPLFQYFKREDGRWRTEPYPNLRAMASVRVLGPEAFGRRMHVRQLIDFRFGTTTWDERIAAIRAQADAFEALAGPPYDLEQFEGAAESMRKSVGQIEKLRGLSWEQVRETFLSEGGDQDPGSPEDFYLLFYLEADEGEAARELPWADKDEVFRAERLPCLTDQEVQGARPVVEGDPSRDAVSVDLDEFGRRVFAKVTKENVGRRIAIVVDGKVVSAPVIRSEIAEGRAQISGTFTPVETREIAKQLNANRERCREFLDQMRSKLPSE